MMTSTRPKSGTAPVSELSPAPSTEAREEWSSEDFGMKVRVLRGQRGLSLKSLSELTGLSVALISQVERGISAPSMRSVRQLAQGLGVDVQSLFSQVDPTCEPSEDGVVRSENRRVLSLGRSGTVMELLTPSDFQELQTFHSYISPMAGSGPDYDSHPGAESGVILAGSLDLWLDGKMTRLRVGDSFSFQSVVPHRYENSGRIMTQVIWVVTPPIY